MLRHADAERGEVPKSFDSARNDLVGHLLGLIDRYGDHSDGGIRLFLFFKETVDVENRNAIYGCPVQVGFDIKAGYNVQSVLLQQIRLFLRLEQLVLRNKLVLCDIHNQFVFLETFND